MPALAPAGRGAAEPAPHPVRLLRRLLRRFWHGQARMSPPVIRAVQREQVLTVRDVGLLPEDEIHRRSRGSTPYDYGHDRAKYPLERILAAAELASSLGAGDVPALRKLLADEDGAVRYWATMGLLMRGAKAVGDAREDLLKRLDDDSPSVRVAAAESL